MRKNSEDGTSKTLDDANSPSPLLPADVSISSVSLLSRFLRFTSDETPCEISTCQRCQLCRSRCISIAPGSIANPRSLFSIVSPEDMLCLGGEKKSPWDLCPMIPSFGRGSSATRFRWPCVPPAPALSFRSVRRSRTKSRTTHRTNPGKSTYPPRQYRGMFVD